MHQIPKLWQFHQKHHYTRYPSSLLSAYADTIQEVLDSLIQLIFTNLLLQRWYNFTEFFICSMCLVLAESGGHSGLRAYSTSVMNGWLLRLFNLELSIEDHDLHHRVGWRHLGKNMGKQTKMFDIWFGTAKPRIESADKYIVWDWHVNLNDTDGTIVGN